MTETTIIGWMFRFYGAPVPVHKRTATRFYYTETYLSRGTRQGFSDISLCTGLFPTEEAAVKAQERIKSSEALSREEALASDLRHRERRAKIIAEFQAKAPTHD